ncbi:DUF2497 domain-containing protein [Phenylobacterium immobile]|uniref:DUF2497 domain-containing protein n=1 Tax=Phenylobacterium immobile TaxID=21 RepID=UPI000B1D21B0|nr:DUF2497 domain-containing protein [Phenylobacterium immobile]
MSEQNDPKQDTNMEDILASIRRIIAEEPEDGAVSAEAASADGEEEPLELTERVDAAAPPPPAAVLEEPPEPPVAPPEAVVEAAAAAQPESVETLVSAPAAAAAGAAFAGLAAAVAPQGQGATVEDLARELLKPMLKAWLDENLEAVVRKAVEVEVERVSRLAR